MEQNRSTSSKKFTASYILSGEITRLKKEASDLLENSKLGYQFNGQKIWKLSLRESKQFSVVEDFPNDYGAG